MKHVYGLGSVHQVEPIIKGANKNKPLIGRRLFHYTWVSFASFRNFDVIVRIKSMKYNQILVYL